MLLMIDQLQAGLTAPTTARKPAPALAIRALDGSRRTSPARRKAGIEAGIVLAGGT